MPIYAYKCSVCGHTRDVLQKISDEPLSICPSCGAAGFAKQVTAAGFQLKGSGWYVTDFRDGGNKPSTSGDASGSAPVSTTAAPTTSASEGTSSGAASDSASSASSTTSAATSAVAAPASGSGTAAT